MCDLWFHIECVGLSTRQLEKVDQFMCAGCKADGFLCAHGKVRSATGSPPSLP